MAEEELSVYSAAHVARNVVEMTTQRHEWRKKGISLERLTGIKAIDDYLNPFWPGDLIITMGGPSCGKSATTRMMYDTVLGRIDAASAAQIARGEEPEKVAAVWIATEESVEKVGAGIVAARSGLQIRDILSGTIGDLDRRAPNALLHVAQLPAFVIGQSVVVGSAKRRTTRMAPSEIQASLNYVVDSGFRIAYIVIDYLQSLDSDVPVESEERHVSRCIDFSRDLGRRYMCPVHVLSQVKGTVFDRKHCIPGLSDGQWSRKIGDRADIQIGVWMPKTGRAIGDEVAAIGTIPALRTTKTLCYVGVGKQRDGDAGDVFVTDLDLSKSRWIGLDTMNMNELVNVTPAQAKNMKIDF